MNKVVNGVVIVLVAVLVAVVMFLVLGWTAAPAASGEPRLITVTGDAEVRVVPDEVILTLGVETSNPELQIARQENDRRVEQILALTREYGIASKYVQTEHVSIEPRYYDSYEKQRFIAYFCRKTVVITLKDISQFEDLVAAALETGATHVHGIQFRTSELRTHKDEARALAVQAAQEKASDMAAVLDQKIGLPYTVKEEETGWWSWYGSWWGSSWGGGMAQNVVQNVGGEALSPDATLAPGQIAVRARVTVSFQLQ